MVRSLALIACLLVLLPACGSGSGGGGGDATPQAPGVLRAVAIEGQGATGTAGFYAALPPFPLMDAHSSGWVAFVALTTDGAKTSVVNAMAPDGNPINVFSAGDPAPGASDGTIAGFGGVWVGNGFLYAHITIAGDSMGRTSGIVSATLTPVNATDRTGVLYHLSPIPGVANPVASFDVNTPYVDEGEKIWLLVEEDTTGDEHLVSVERTSSNLTTRAQVGGALTAGVTIDVIEAFGVDPTGTYFSIVALTNMADSRIYLRNTGVPSFVEIMRDGDTIPGTADQVGDIHTTGSLSVYANGRVVWMGEANTAAPNDVLLTGDDMTLAPGVITLARSGDAAPLSGGGMFGPLLGLQLRSATTIPQLGANVVASGNGVTFGTYGLIGGPPPVLATDNLSITTVGNMGAAYVGLAPANAYREVSRDGSFLCANILDSGLSAVLWLVPGDRIYGLALEGQAAPQGGAFGSFAATSAHTVASGVCLFRAPLSGAGSGLFRQGP